jgi:5-amino-6-(5-phosphoribosylamino)uracil reductase
MNRPYVTLSCAMSIDGYLDSAAPHKLAMSNSADFDRVDQLRADSDAILVGASTVRRDDPRLLVRSEERRLLRAAAGLPRSPAKVTVTATGAIPCDAAFFTEGDAEKLVYCPRDVAPGLAATLHGVATVVAIGEGEIPMAEVLRDLDERGVRRLMVEGGGHVHTQFLIEGLADELQLVVAPFFVGESRAPRFVESGRFPWNAKHRATLVETRQIEDVVLLRYALSDRCAVTTCEPASSARLSAGR